MVQTKTPSKKDRIYLRTLLIFGWFQSDEVTPESYLSILDMSSLTAENSANTTAGSSDFCMYADEFGVLRYAKTNDQLHQMKHSPIVKNSEVSVSNIIITGQDEVINNNYSTRIEDFEDAKVAHSFYVSRYFTILPKTAAVYNGIGKSLKLKYPDKYNIKVVDSSGKKYVDEFGQDNYEIFIENYPTILEESSVDYFRIIVALDDADPIGLQLVYDKFERNSEGIPYNQFLNYKEYINSMPLYAYVVEESEVIDPSSVDKRVYSTQLFAHKENKLLKNKTEDEGWKVVTPKKAIQDPRTFQNFNWRLLAKINYNFSKIKDIYQNTERAVLNVAVLYSGPIENMHNPYIFANLEESVINQQNFLFENPLRPVNSNKTQRAYWALDIDSFISTIATNQDIDPFQYDFIVWTPNQTITPSQKRALDLFLENGVSVFLDCSMLDQSSLSSSGLENFDYSINATSKSSGYINIVSEYEEGDDNLNGWDLTEYQETSEIGRHNVFGNRINILNNDSIVPIRVFNGNPESVDGSAKSIVSIVDGANTFTAMLKDKYNVNSEFSSYVVVCLNPFLTFINDNYGTSGLGVAGSNRGETNSFPIGKPGDQTAFLSASALGPNKLFYNIICESNKNKVNSRTKFSDNSTIIWNISPWRNSWVINGNKNENNQVTVLFEDEIQQFKFKYKSELREDISIFQDTSKFCREIVTSIGDSLIADFEATSIEQDAASIINSDFSNVEFYIECTNNNVEFLNFEKIDNTNYIFSDSKTSYNIHKLTSIAKEFLKSSPLTLDAYSNVVSKEFDLKSIYYPYMILDYTDYENITKSVIKTPKEYLPGSQFVRDYDFAFKTQIFVTQTRTNRYTYKVSWSTQFSTGLSATVGNLTYLSKQGVQAKPEGELIPSIQQQSSENPITITNSSSIFKGYKYPTNVYSLTDIQSESKTQRTTTSNNFHYTWDIPLSGRWDEYMVYGSSTGSEKDQTSDNPPTVVVETVETSNPFANLFNLNSKYDNVDSYVLNQKPPLAKSEEIKNEIKTKYGTWEAFSARGLNAYAFWPKSPTVGAVNKGENALLTTRWSNFEKFASNEVDITPGLTKDIKIDIIRKIYVSDETTYNLGLGKIIDIAKTYNMPAGSTGRNLFTRILGTFLDSYDIFLTTEKPATAPTAPVQTVPTTKTVTESTTSKSVASNTGSANAGSGNSLNLVKNNYVYYIQYTLKVTGHPVAVDGIYGTSTKNAVFAYQSAKNVRPPDGIVDSQTKSAMASFWLDLYKNNKNKFETLRSQAPEQAKQYITRAIKYSDIAAICTPSSSDEYRRISYTGTAGPTSIQDYIVIEVPQLKKQDGTSFPWQELTAVNIRSGGWSLGIKQIFLYEQDLVTSSHQIPQLTKTSIKAPPGNIIQSSSLIEPNSAISIPVSQRRGIKYIMIEVYGNALNDGVHGPYAEGFSIKDVTFTIQTPGLPITAQNPEYTTIDDIPATATATGTIYGETELTSGDFGIFNLGTISQALASSRSKITQITLNDLSVTVNPIVDGAPLVDADGVPVQKTFSKSYNQNIYSSGGNLVSSQYSWEQDQSNISVEAMSTSSSIDGANPAINSVIKNGPTGATNLTNAEITEQFAILSNRAPVYLITTTNGIEVISDEISEEYPVNNYYLADADTQGLTSKQNTKLSVNAKDGVVVLTNATGSAQGFPDYSKFIQPNIETSFGSTILKWDLKDSSGQSVPAPDGLQWGFYNIRTKQFLGIKLSYQYYVSNKRDIFIAVHAYDADRDSSTLENIIGIDNRSGTLTEFAFPAKSICPLYSVKVSSRAKIAISAPPKDLSKFDTWFVNLSRGRFYKQIEIPIEYNFYDWKKNYKGAALRCFYDTTKIKTPSSDFFGSGYYDIWEENPIVLSENEIQVRHGSFVVAQEQVDKEAVNDLYTDASPIEPWFTVFIKNKTDGHFEKVNYDIVKHYNKHTGIISFSREIVPLNPYDIKVNYVVKNPNIIMYHIDGKEIPLNPYVNLTGSFYNDETISPVSAYHSAPIHFYILPSTVEELVNGEYVTVPEYELPNSVVNFTYDFNIFNKNSVTYNPFAIYIGTASVNNFFNLKNTKIVDLRVKGGGISPSATLNKEVEKNMNVLSFNDIKSGKGRVYPNGGYVVVQIPKEVKDNFRSIDDIYAIVRSNLTAGVAFDIHDMDGNDWRAS